MNAFEYLAAKDKHDADTHALAEATPRSPRLTSGDLEEWCIEASIDPASTHTPAMVRISAGKRGCTWGHTRTTLANAQRLRDWLIEVLSPTDPAQEAKTP